MSASLHTPDDETDIEQLLKHAGPRVIPPDTLVREVRAEVHRAWQESVAQRKRQTKVRAFTAAASIGAAAILGGAIFVTQDIPQQRMAHVARIEGEVMRDAGLFHAPESLRQGSPVYVGDALSSAADSRIALALEDGLSVRLDAGSHMEIVAHDLVRLGEGAVYIDAASDDQGSIALTVETEVGAVRHLGTQYEVRAHSEGVRVSVREGRVAVDTDAGLYAADAGDQIDVGEHGLIARSRLSPIDPLWNWVVQVAPTFDIENRSLSEFFDWLSRETGWVVNYASPEVQKQAQQTILRGSIRGLQPRIALDAVLASTRFSVSEGDANHLLVAIRE